MLRSSIKWLGKYWFFGFVLFSILFLQILPGHRAFDDAYITYRYALNISSGNGFTYNPGENVLGTTTPLYTILLAVLASVFSISDFPSISIYINSIADIASILILVRIISNLKFPKYLAYIIGFAYLYNPVRIGVSLGGMETALVVSIILATMYVYVVQKNYPIAAILSGIAFLARPDTLLLPILFAFHQIFWLKRFPIRESFLSFITTGPWLIFSGFYFGSPIPHSIIAKSTAYILDSRHATATILGYMAMRTPSGNLGWPPWLIGLSLLIFLWLFIIGSISIIKKSSRSVIMVLFPVLYILGLMIANPLLFLWYYPPFIVLFNSLIIIGLYSLVRGARSLIPAFVTALFVILLLFAEWRALDQPKEGLAVNLRDHESLYERVAIILMEEIDEGSSIAMPEIGVLGYSFPESRVIDIVGLVSPEVMKYLHKSPLEGQTFSPVIPIDLILDLDPDYVLSLEVFIRPTLLKSDAFFARYSLVEIFPTYAMGSRGFYVFKRIQSKSD